MESQRITGHSNISQAAKHEHGKLFGVKGRSVAHQKGIQGKLTSKGGILDFKSKIKLAFKRVKSLFARTLRTKEFRNQAKEIGMDLKSLITDSSAPIYAGKIENLSTEELASLKTDSFNKPEMGLVKNLLSLRKKVGGNAFARILNDIPSWRHNHLVLRAEKTIHDPNASIEDKFLAGKLINALQPMKSRNRAPDTLDFCRLLGTEKFNELPNYNEARQAFDAVKKPEAKADATEFARVMVFRNTPQELSVQLQKLLCEDSDQGAMARSAFTKEYANELINSNDPEQKMLGTVMLKAIYPDSNIFYEG